VGWRPVGATPVMRSVGSRLVGVRAGKRDVGRRTGKRKGRDLSPTGAGSADKELRWPTTGKDPPKESISSFGGSSGTKPALPVTRIVLAQGLLTLRQQPGAKGRLVDNETKPHTEQPTSAHYVIARHTTGSPELLHLSLKTGEKALPVFPLEELAQRFFEHRALGSEWHVRKSYNGEMISLLLGACSDVERVLPNPLPDPLAAQDALLNFMDRKSFIDFLLTPGNPNPGKRLPAP
jgi:hypothetical protein